MSKQLIIIGAPRSGTNMVRDLICEMPGFSTWPCDEINYIWRRDNREVAHDEFERSYATDRAKNYIRKQFGKLEKATGCDWVVEKTCANSLRVGFVDEVFPTASFLVIVRDGLDCVESMQRRWVAPFDLGYTKAKARYVPPADLWFYGQRYIVNRLNQLISPDHKLSH